MSELYSLVIFTGDGAEFQFLSTLVGLLLSVSVPDITANFERAPISVITIFWTVHPGYFEMIHLLFSHA